MMSAHQRIRGSLASKLFGVCFEHTMYAQTMLRPLRISEFEFYRVG